MDVDRYIQTRDVKYMNQPPLNQDPKRSAGASFQGTVNKIQRNFHINADFVPRNDWCERPGYPPEGGEVDVQQLEDGTDCIPEYFRCVPQEDATMEAIQEEQPDEVQLAINFLD